MLFGMKEQKQDNYNSLTKLKMKLKRHNRIYTAAYDRLARIRFSDFEFDHGLDFIACKFPNLRLYKIYSSTIFWNWWCQQMENISKEAFYITNIQPHEISLIKLEREGLKSAFQGCYRNFLNQDIRPSQTVIKQIHNELRNKLECANPGNQNPVSVQSTTSKYVATS